MRTTRITVKKAISLASLTELLILATYFISFSFFINLQIAVLSSFFIMLGSMYAYKKMVHTQLESEVINEERDLLDTIEDPHELYEEDIPEQDLEKDLKTIVKEEKKKIKTLNVKSMKHGAKGSVSLFRLVPYIFLILGFIALNNNKLLDIKVYLPSLLIGIVVGYVVSRDIFSPAKQ
jgi:hypothetical protein